MLCAKIEREIKKKRRRRKGKTHGEAFLTRAIEAIIEMSKHAHIQKKKKTYHRAVVVLAVFVIDQILWRSEIQP